MFDLLRDNLYRALADSPVKVLKCIHESSGEVEETVNNIVQTNPSLLAPFQNLEAAGYDAIEYVPPKTLYRLVDRFPEKVLDGKAMTTPYMAIKLSDENATARAREDSKERVLSYIKDALRVISGYTTQRVQKNELTRASLSVEFLIKELSV